MPTNLQASVARLSAALLFTLFAVSAAIAQSDLTSEADALFERRGYFEAAKEYEAVGAKIKSDLTLAGYCFYQAGEAFRLYHKPKDAIENYQKALGLKYGSRENKLFLMYGDCLRDIEEFEDAIDMYEKYKGAGGDARVADERIDKTNDALDYLDEQASRYIVEPMVLLNKPQYDLSPTFTGKDQDEMVFASSRPSAQGSEEDPITGESTMDLFYTELDKKGTRWSEPTPLGNTICTDDNEGAACFSSDGKTLYFTRCVNMDGSNLACDLYMAKKQGSRFGASMPLEIINRDVNDSSQVGHPALTPDDQYLIFASDLPGGEGGKDLWYIEANNGSFAGATPINLGPGINTAGDEMFPHVRDNGDLYWSTNGREGLGGLDIWTAEIREGEMAWGQPKALPDPINSVSDDFGIAYQKGMESGMFTSNRAGGKGSDDLYSFYLPEVVVNLIVEVWDDDHAFLLEGAKVTAECSCGTTFSGITNDKGLVELADVGEEMTFDFTVSFEDAPVAYIAAGGTKETHSYEDAINNEIYSFRLKRARETGNEIGEVLYPFGSADLLINNDVNSADTLNRLVTTLNKNPNFVIRLVSHTDSRGSASDNQALSTKRAETCVNYLIAQGIAADRLLFEGRGESEPLLTDAEINALPESEREAAHQKNRRTEFDIVSQDYKPKQE